MRVIRKISMIVGKNGKKTKKKRFTRIRLDLSTAFYWHNVAWRHSSTHDAPIPCVHRAAPVPADRRLDGALDYRPPVEWSVFEFGSATQRTQPAVELLGDPWPRRSWNCTLVSSVTVDTFTTSHAEQSTASRERLVLITWPATSGTSSTVSSVALRRSFWRARSSRLNSTASTTTTVTRTRHARRHCTPRRYATRTATTTLRVWRLQLGGYRRCRAVASSQTALQGRMSPPACRPLPGPVGRSHQWTRRNINRTREAVH